MHDANDFEALTTLYRKIFRFLLDFVPSDSKQQQSSDRNIEREVAAALESVFPRIGLKAFVQLSYDDKTAQLMELGRIVFGIRLFNRYQSRGGAGIDPIEETSSQLGDDVIKEITREIELLNHLCNKYQEVIVKAHLQKRRNQIKRREYAERRIDDYKEGRDGEREEEEEEYDANGQPILLHTGEQDKERKRDYKDEKKGYSRGSNTSLPMNDEDEDEEVGDWLVSRWSFELANRRQYLAFLRSLSEEITISHKKITELIENMSTEQAALAELVGNKASVSKEQVYPKFDNLASIWLTLWEESKLLSARHHTYVSLKKFKSSYVTALTERMYSTLGRIIELKGEELSLAATQYGEYDYSGPGAPGGAGGGSRRSLYDADSKEESSGSGGGAKGSKKRTDDDDEEDGQEEGDGDAKSHPGADSKALEKSSSIELLHKPFKPSKKTSVSIQKEIILETTTPSGATLLSVHDTPDFMQLPLELQGFCPWTIVQANGLLVPGKPSLGVIRYENLFYVCEHKIAIKAFMTDPDDFIKKIISITQKCPEYIHLLRLQTYFPSASIARLIDHPEFDTQQHNNHQHTSTTSHTKPLTKDASTETPIHYQESYINPNYHWNEWELRRRILKVANLKNCQTTSQQTDLSHFHRESETQIYLPKTKETQTRKDQGTNPAIKTTYIAGLRGKLPNENQAISRYVKSEGVGKNQARVVTLTLDP
jgi:plasmid maintenance system antidote protein VapI